MDLKSHRSRKEEISAKAHFLTGLNRLPPLALVHSEQHRYPLVPITMTCEDCACSQTCSGATYQTPLRHQSTATKGSESSPLWSTTPAKGSNDQTYGSVTSTEPTQSSGDDGRLAGPARCESNNIFRGGVCCRELKASDQRRLVNPDLVRDVIIGLSDGLTVSAKTRSHSAGSFTRNSRDG